MPPGCVTGQGAIAWALGRLPASVTSVVVLVQPVVAAVLGWILFGEVFGPGQMLGGAIALTGVAALSVVAMSYCAGFSFQMLALRSAPPARRSRCSTCAHTRPFQTLSPLLGNRH